MLKGVWESIFRRKTSTTVAPPLSSAEAEALDDLRNIIEMEVVGGFASYDRIAAYAVDAMAGQADDAFVRREAERITQEVLSAHLASQADWPEVTDCDRLDAAFSALEASGVIARQNFSCCGNCGSGEIWDEIQDALKEGRPARGYTFYHQQDTEGAIESKGVYLNYGAHEEGEEAAVTVGHEIVAAIHAKGLTTRWDGTIGRRIKVIMDWKRRPGPGPGSQGSAV